MDEASSSPDVTLAIKTKRIFNDLKKMYIKNIYRAFLLIDRQSKIYFDPSTLPKTSIIRESSIQYSDSGIMNTSMLR